MRTVLALFLMSFALPAWAQNSNLGEALYRVHCASCHGDEARGDGVLSGALLRDPPDLTGLATRNDGVFPTDYVVSLIDGSERLMSHGDPMPVFTLLLDGPSVIIEGGDGSDVAAPGPIADIVVWLERIQE